MKGDVEAGEKVDLLNKSKEAPLPQKETAQQKADVKDAAFWLFMLFLASVTMTVGNKVRRV